jgi:hypothetical protein
MSSINNINSNFRKIAVVDANDSITGITTGSLAADTLTLTGVSNLNAVGNVRISGGTAGQVLTATGVGSGLSWATLPAASAWVSSAITIKATVLDPNKGTRTMDFIRYRPLGGKTYQVEMGYNQSGAGTAGTGNYLFTLPGGLQFDTTYHPVNTNGNAGGITTLPVWAAALPTGAGYTIINGNASTMAIMAYDATRFYMAETQRGAGAANYGAIMGQFYYQLSFAISFRASFIFTATT